MNNPLKNLFNNRSASNDFLLSKTEAVSEPGAVEQDQPLLFDELTRNFPDILAGQAFINRAMEELKAVDAFQALIVRIDTPEDDAADQNVKPAAALQVETARILNRFCENQNWQWGKVAREIFGCFLSLTNGTGEAIFLAAFTFIEPGKDVALTSSPTFALIPHYLNLVGAKLKEVAKGDSPGS